jgi:hypothetical protein
MDGQIRGEHELPQVRHRRLPHLLTCKCMTREREHFLAEHIPSGAFAAGDVVLPQKRKQNTVSGALGNVELSPDLGERQPIRRIREQFEHGERSNQHRDRSCVAAFY